MYDNEIINDFAQRCGGEATVGVLGANAEACQAITEKIATLNLGARVLEEVASATTVSAVIFLVETGEIESQEQKIIALKKLNKPYVIVINEDENSDNSGILAGQLQQRLGASVIFSRFEGVSIEKVMQELLFEFPVTSFDVIIPEWLQFLPAESSANAELICKIKETAEKIFKMKDCTAFDTMLTNSDYWQGEVAVKLTPSTGFAEVTAFAKEGVFYDMISEIAGEKISDKSGLMGYIKGASEAKRGFDKVKDAFECAKVNGYGIVNPDDNDMSLEAPQIVRHGSSVGIKLKATAPSYHIIKVEVSGEASPIMGSVSESEQIVKGMMAGFEANPEEMWDTNVFGKSLKTMVKDGLYGKVTCMQSDTKVKMRRAITRIINEGKGGVICILL